jgi:isoleucyl-tRNA synthetase
MSSALPVAPMPPKWVEIQKARNSADLGIEGEWDNPYLTMKFESEASIVGEFLRMAMTGSLVRGAKPIMWSPVERTALAEAEVEYHDRKVPVIWVKFPVRKGTRCAFQSCCDLDDHALDDPGQPGGQHTIPTSPMASTRSRR